ncbi:tRNA (guanosine(46)-N7)-methyltransferase TrmB [Hyphomicrobium sulfonivorans]|uniref:tRNA (guanosine(46)-N7)-methyltransferase TrmB n=1 Tax=Hyphomicrobium sulfonivorans TaxID=121290 RepID=UPI001570F9F7|nr:tRNA (guanosine(46)-N7)-methyltransferase TrmB [Hyphomicrobium sulfonivorans]MBI1651280.1 tRNA (guanosine(46)-N7)-methyltransferase TrmB [Hyphomicrobium sulfonivorans]NSL73247.1 tRNA (guanosine(46)-N7)-methyltransferase TrmB [Hyphomicrobium sulfonivorans]
MTRPEHELRSFGRRRGRALSARQQHLLDEVMPKLALPLAEPAPEPIGQLFPHAPQDVWLEIGFGGGEHLIWQAQANADVGLIGCEVFEEGVVKVLSAVDTLGLSNVRVSDEDARAVLRWLPPASLSRAFILFPDPWPKRKHVKRRLINPALLDELARAMRPGAELRIATDIGDYLRTILMAFRGRVDFRWLADSPEDWRVRGDDWPQTRYEAKAVREGRRRYFLRFRRV